MEDEDVDATPEVTGHHITKRYRKNKFAVAVFDEKARQEFLTGFRKRKNKRRKVAAQQNDIKERQRRLQERKEIREAKKAALLEQMPKPAANAEEVNETEAEESELAQDDAPNVSGTTTYDDGDSTILVTTCSLDPDDDDAEEDHHDAPKHTQKPKTLLGKRASVPLGATQPKKAKSVNKPKKIVSEKRKKKLSRREKSVPKNQRSKKGGRRKK